MNVNLQILIDFQPVSQEFEFPNVTEGEEQKEQKKQIEEVEQVKKNYKRQAGIAGGRKRGLPTFFGL